MAEMIYVTGGARSGKSGYAQQLTEACAGELLYVATATAGDREMAERIARHQQRRGTRWETLEEPYEVLERLPGAAAGKNGILFDCVTLWLTNLMLRGDDDATILAAVEQIPELASRLSGTLVLVSNEIGSGIVPENGLARRFRDLAGHANQRLAEASDQAWVVISGIPLQLK